MLHPHRTLASILLTFVLIVSLSPVVRAQATTAAEPATRAASGRSSVVLAAYNLHNLFDIYDDPYTADEATRVKPRAEIEKLAGGLRKLNADVVAVEEVENEGVLQAVVRDFVPELNYKHVVVMPTNSDRGGNIGVISRLPIQSITSRRWTPLTLEGEKQTWHFARDLLQVNVTTPSGKTLEVYIVHLKSKLNSPDDPKSGKWRLAEARGVRKVLEARLLQDRSALFCVMGDFNDTPESPALQELLQARVGDGPLLIDGHGSLPKDKRITFPSKKYGKETIDYILLSPELSKHVKPDSARVVDDAEMYEASDHLPVTLTVDVP